jgi:hypothetical protein
MSFIFWLIFIFSVVHSFWEVWKEHSEFLTWWDGTTIRFKFGWRHRWMHKNQRSEYFPYWARLAEKTASPWAERYSKVTGNSGPAIKNTNPFQCKANKRQWAPNHRGSSACQLLWPGLACLVFTNVYWAAQIPMALGSNIPRSLAAPSTTSSPTCCHTLPTPIHVLTCMIPSHASQFSSPPPSNMCTNTSLITAATSHHANHSLRLTLIAL